MTTVLRVITKEGSEYIDIPNPYNFRKNEIYRKWLKSSICSGNWKRGILGKRWIRTIFIPLDEDEYIESLNKSVIEEDKISFTYSFLSRKLDWFEFCDLTGTNEWAKNEGVEFNGNDIYYVSESKAKQFNLI